MRFVLHPGYVRSQTDGQEHFIGGPALARLYGIDIRQPNVVFGDVPEYKDLDGDVHLRPRYDGNYTLTKDCNMTDTGNKPDMKYQPHPEYRFWLHDPEGSGMTYWRTAEKRDAAAARAIECYRDDGVWTEEVEFVSAGEVTHIAQCLNKKMRPDDLDEEGCDGEGVYWGDFEWMGNYQLEPISSNGACNEE